MRDRLTMDSPTTNTGNVLNLAYAKDGNVYLRYGVEDVNLCDYVSNFATKQGCNYTPNEIMEGACLECDCEVNLLYCLAVQAAELRERLKYYEDLEEQGRLIVPPCKVGDKVYVVDYTRLGNMIFDCTIEEISHFTYGTYYYLNWGLHIPRFKACQENSFGKTVFLTKEEAEQALKARDAE
ncbi:MAG: hypothetical protein IJD83_06525 [Clostridia bacterium]|nr:hypothetical protein [Clostridia bacterium]